MLPFPFKEARYVNLIIFIMIGIVVLVLWPIDFSKNISQEQQAQQINAVSQGCQPFTGLNPPTVPAFEYELGDDEDNRTIPINQGVFIDPSKAQINYVLKLTDVLIKTTYAVDKKLFLDPDDNGRVLTGGDIVDISGRGKFMLFYPIRHGTLSLATKFGNQDKIKVPRYGILYLVHLENNQPKIITVKEGSEELKNTFVLTDIYQNPNAPMIPQEAINECLGLGKKENRVAATQSTQQRNPPEITFPDQKKSDDKKQLQLEYFLPQKGAIATSVQGVWNLHCKPAIYLYPKEETKVNVKVKTKGFLTYTDPLYPETGWDVLAYPDGKLEYLSMNNEPTNQLTLDYLYYESKVPDELIEKPKEGYVLEWSRLNEFYGLILPKLGLNETQTKDFKDYWNKALPYSPYYFVGVIDQKNIDSFEPLEVTPKPDLSIRVRLYFQALEKKPIDDLQYFPAMNHELITHNLKLIEWGGMVKTNPLDKFTCSQ